MCFDRGGDFGVDPVVQGLRVAVVVESGYAVREIPISEPSHVFGVGDNSVSCFSASRLVGDGEKVWTDDGELHEIGDRRALAHADVIDVTAAGNPSVVADDGVTRVGLWDFRRRGRVEEPDLHLDLLDLLGVHGDLHTEGG